MPTITSAGIGSGLDVQGLVDKLVAAEGEPVRTRLDRKEARLQEGLSALGTFQGAVSEFQATLGSLENPDSFSAIDVISDNEDRLTATGSKNAIPGDYEVGIVQLAQAQKLASSALASDIDAVGTGGLTISLGRYDAASNSFSANPDIPPLTLNITSENNSLRGIADAINKASAGVRASVINDGSGFRLVLSSLAEGKDSAIRVSVVDDDGDNTDMAGLSMFAYDEVTTTVTGTDASGLPTSSEVAITNMQQTVAAQDAIINVDGLEISRSGNSIDDVIQGVVMELHPGAEGTITRLNVAVNTEVASNAIREFVGKYNELVNVVQELTGYNPETRTAGPLSGDASVRGVLNQIRRVMSQGFGTVNSSYDSLASIGIDTQRNGTLTLDEGELQKAIDDNLQEVMQLFSTTGSASDALVKYRGAAADTPAGAYRLSISQMATQGQYSGSVVSDSSFTLNAGDNGLRVRIDGTLSDKLLLREGSYTGLDELATELQNAINRDATLSAKGIKATASFSGTQLQIVSSKYGSDSNVEIVSIDPGVLGVSGLAVGAGSAGSNVQGAFNGVAGTGDGLFLTGETAAHGLKVEILGGASGERGKVFHVNGIASQLSDIFDSYEGNEGLFKTRNKGFTERLEDIEKQREQLARKLENTESRYMKQFSTLDTLLGNMRSTSEFLTQQLAGLPWAAKNRK